MTPSEMTALANGPIALSERPNATVPTLHDVRAALRAAAVVIDAARKVLDEPRESGRSTTYYLDLHENTEYRLRQIFVAQGVDR